MGLPKEIQNLILIRYYFYQWKEKIEKVNQQYHKFFSIRDCTYCRNSTCQYLCWGKYGSDSFLFNWRCSQHIKECECINNDIFNWKMFIQNKLDLCVVGKLPNT